MKYNRFVFIRVLKLKDGSFTACVTLSEETYNMGEYLLAGGKMTAEFVINNHFKETDDKRRSDFVKELIIQRAMKKSADEDVNSQLLMKY